MNKYRLRIAPPITDFNLLGLHECKLILFDGTFYVNQTLSINVTNSAPFLYTNISSERVGVDGQKIMDALSNFRDDEGHSLTIYDANYTFNSVTNPIPGSIFSIVNYQRF
jgi:hypothetical protein